MKISDRPIIDSLDVLCGLAKLTEGQREALIDRYVLDMTLQEIADSMGISLARVGQLIEDAKKQLARMYA